MKIENKALKKLLKSCVILGISILAILINRKAMESKALFKVAESEYLILAYNDLGMHCIQDDYSAFMILPPANTVRVQVFEKGIDKAKLIDSGIIVKYEMNNNTTSVDKSNFWKYAKDYGYDLKPNEGITGNYLSGVCKLSKDKNYYEAEYVPVIPFNDGSKVRNPYQTMTVTVIDEATKKVLAQEDSIVVPVSDEMSCSNCHGKEDTYANILKAHDRKEKTSFYSDLNNNIRHKCNECHSDNALGALGTQGVPSLSLAVHDFHAPIMGMSDLQNTCYNCHPGIETQCNRGAMYKAGITCSDSKCHGNMENVAQSLKDGRRDWLDEPKCSNCHGELYSIKDNQLYREAYLQNGPRGMIGRVKCATCHNSPHAEWISSLSQDNEIPIKIYGKPDFIKKCTACHENRGNNKIHNYKGE